MPHDLAVSCVRYLTLYKLNFRLFAYHSEINIHVHLAETKRKLLFVFYRFYFTLDVKSLSKLPGILVSNLWLFVDFPPVTLGVREDTTLDEERL